MFRRIFTAVMLIYLGTMMLVAAYVLAKLAGQG